MSQSKYCPNCEDYRDFRQEHRTESYSVRGMDVGVELDVEVCCTCNETLFDSDRDQAILKTVYAQYRTAEGLLTPEEIKTIRQRYNLSQQSFATLLGMSEATINKYESGSLQDHAHDEAIRACENPDVFKSLLKRRGNLLSKWKRIRAEKSSGYDIPEASDTQSVIDPIAMSSELSKPSIQSGFRSFSYTTYAAVVAWFCQRLGEIPSTKMNKLLFYADFLHFKNNSISLTGSTYRAIQYGPVPKFYGTLRDRMESDGYIRVREVEFSNGWTAANYCLEPSASDALKTLDSKALAVLEAVVHELGHLTAKAISDRSHEEDACEDTQYNQLIPYDKAMTLSVSVEA